MTIEEFIEARIAEDQENAACDGVEEDGHGMCYYWSERRERDAEALTAILELHNGSNEVYVFGQKHPSRTLCPTDGNRYPCQSLRILASTWRDHEDYDKGWTL